MIHYYTSREISEKLEVNLARWKRWSRAFLPPDPLGGMQSGYARQYAFKDLFKVFLGGHLLSHLKLSLPESIQVLADLSPWLKKNGFFDPNGSAGAPTEKIAEKMASMSGYRIYFCRSQATEIKSGSVFGYLIRHTVNLYIHASVAGRHLTETFEETILHADAPDGSVFMQHPHVYLINLSALRATLTEKLHD